MTPIARSSRFRLALSTGLLASACVAAVGHRVTQNPQPAAAKEKVLPAPPRLQPYFSDSTDPNRPHAVEFRAVEQMTEPDRLQAANAESSIAERARYTNLEFNQGAWSYQQVVCPALPNHIFLRFLRNNGTGDVSMFSASIPRGSEGRVRIVPIRMRGYSLFSPAPINALTISTFNHIRAEENPDNDPAKAPDWLGTALCYEALAGGHPQVATVSTDPSADKLPIAGEALLDVGSNGGAEIAFTDVSTQPRPTRWTMTFDKKGRLVKGGHAPVELYNIAVEHPLAVNQVGPARPMSVPQTKTYNPSTPAAVTQHPLPPPAPIKPANSPSQTSIPPA
jgi:hypothetical protein